MKVSGNLDFANTDHIALSAGILGAELCFVNWSDITDTHYIVVRFTQYVTHVLRGFANSLESGDISFSGSTEDGLLVLRFGSMAKDTPKAEESDNPETPNSDGP